MPWSPLMPADAGVESTAADRVPAPTATNGDLHQDDAFAATVAGWPPRGGSDTHIHLP